MSWCGLTLHSLYYVLSGLRQTSLRSVTNKSTMTRLRVSQLVFSSELEMLCESKITETRLSAMWEE